MTWLDLPTENNPCNCPAITLGLWLRTFHQHTYGHHSYTNDFALDPDVHHFEGILRMHMDNPFSPLHHLLFIKCGLTHGVASLYIGGGTVDCVHGE